MSYVDKISNIVDKLDMGEPVFKLRIRSKYISADEKEWNPNFNTNNFTEACIDFNIKRYRMFDSSRKEYYVNKDELINSIIKECVDSIILVFSECSPYDQPRRTNVYKDFIEVVKSNKNNESFRNAIFDIQEYYFNSALTDSITHPSNDVHRKNIYHLLCLMEKSYGKKTSNE